MGNTESFAPGTSSNPNDSNNAMRGTPSIFLDDSSNSSSNASGGLPGGVTSRVESEELSEFQTTINQYMEEINNSNEKLENLKFELLIRSEQKHNYSLIIKDLRDNREKLLENIPKYQGAAIGEESELTDRKDADVLTFLTTLETELDAELYSLKLEKVSIQSKVDFYVGKVKYLLNKGVDKKFRKEILGEGDRDIVVKKLYDERKAIIRERKRLNFLLIESIELEKKELSAMKDEDKKSRERKIREELQAEIKKKEEEEEERTRQIREEEKRIQEQDTKDKLELLRRLIKHEEEWKTARAKEVEEREAEAKAREAEAKARAEQIREQAEIAVEVETRAIKAIEEAQTANPDIEFNMESIIALSSGSSTAKQTKEYQIKAQQKFELEKIKELIKIREESNRKCSEVKKNIYIVRKDDSVTKDVKKFRLRKMNIDALGLKLERTQQIFELLDKVDILEKGIDLSGCELLKYFCYKMMVSINETEDTNLSSKFEPDSGEIVGFGNMCNTKCPLCLYRIVPSLINPDEEPQPVFFLNPLSPKIFIAYHVACWINFLSRNRNGNIREPVTNIELPEDEIFLKLDPPYDACSQPFLSQLRGNPTSTQRPNVRRERRQGDFSLRNLPSNYHRRGYQQSRAHPIPVRVSTQLTDGSRPRDDRRGGSKRRRTSKLRKRKTSKLRKIKKRKPSNSKKRK